MKTVRLLMVGGMMLAGMLAGCARHDEVLLSAESGFVEDVGAQVAAADWDHAEPVTQLMSNYAYSPRDLVFKAGQPYVLRMTNADTKTHTFKAPGFFRAIAVKSLVTTQGPNEATIREPRLENIVLPAGALKELSFVAVRPGTYAFECDQPFHAIMGMTGTVDIQ